MKGRHLALFVMITGIAGLLAGCQTLRSAPSPAISVAFTPGFTPPSAMNSGTIATLAASVTNDPKSMGVAWTVTCGSALCGNFSPASTPSTVHTQFTAPSAVPSGNNVLVTATSVADSTKSVSAAITITQGSAITVTILTPPGSMTVDSTAPFTAVVTNDPQNAGVDWSVSCGNAPCGSFITANPVASGSPATYQAPANINTVTLTATSVTDNTKSASTTVNITVASLLPDGTYVFHLGGTDSTSANGESEYYVAGAFTVSGGLITGGEQDFEDFNDALTDTINPNTSSLASTADGNLQIILDTGDPDLGVNGVETLNASVVSSTRALIAEYDTSATGTGTLDLQNSQAAPSGGYAFFASGIDSSNLPIAFGGVLNVDGLGSISGNGSIFDLNDAFFQGLAQNQSLSPSTVLSAGGSATPDSFGRVVFTLNPANGSIGQMVLVAYVISASTIQVVETVDSLGAITGGTALGQGSNSGMFANSYLSGSTYVVGAKGSDTNGPLQLAGGIGFSSTDNSVSGNTTFNDIANQVSGNISAGTYVVDATGRVTVAGLSGATFNNATLQLYLDGNGNALSISMDTSDVTSGYALQHVAGASFSGSYAINAVGNANLSGEPAGNLLSAVEGAKPDRSAPPPPPAWSAVGQVSTANTGDISGFSDFNILGGPLTANVELGGTATGSGEIMTGSLVGLGAESSTTPDSFTYYIIDPGRVFGIETDATQLGLAYFEQAPPPK